MKQSLIISVDNKCRKTKKLATKKWTNQKTSLTVRPILLIFAFSVDEHQKYWMAYLYAKKIAFWDTLSQLTFRRTSNVKKIVVFPVAYKNEKSPT